MSMTEEDRPELLSKSKVFCMLPWAHLYVHPNGQVFPCCISKDSPPLGCLQDTPLRTIWNSPAMRQLRLNMLTEKQSVHCSPCYEREAVGFQSLRQDQLRGLGHHFPLVKTTGADGTLPKFHMPWMSIRFSNECNFRCRTCGSDSSTGWYADESALFGDLGKPFPLRPTSDTESLWRQIEEFLPTVEQIYFAGGEPLIQSDQYRLLSLLAERGLFNVFLSYVSNFSVLSLHGRDILPLWRKFEKVELWASLDGSGKRGEYLRKNQVWDNVLKNRGRLAAECPNVRFVITPTLSVMNALHVPDFHWDWLQKGYVQPENFYLTLLLDPPEYRIQVLPEPFKRKAIERYERHMEDLARVYGERSRQAQDQFRSAVNYLKAADMSHLLEKFKLKTRSLDDIRKESFAETFPELAALMG